MSRDKGKRGEREFAKMLTEWGVSARRSQQRTGRHGDPDLILDDFDDILLEVKRVESNRISDLRRWLDRAEEDAEGVDPDSICEWVKPVVAHRPNNRPWVVAMYADVFAALLEELGELRRET